MFIIYLIYSKGDKYPYSNFFYNGRATVAEVLHYVCMYVIICVIKHGVIVIVIVIDSQVIVLVIVIYNLNVEVIVIVVDLK